MCEFLDLADTVPEMTTLIDEGRALVVRCDHCRRLWPITRERLETPGWSHDVVHDLHVCPVCSSDDSETRACIGSVGSACSA
jgi:hypothetical protein